MTEGRSAAAAMASARRDLPLAVGPAISTAFAAATRPAGTIMELVLSLITGEANAPLRDDHATRADRALVEAGCTLQESRWLAAGIAYERLFAGDRTAAAGAAQAALAGESIDTNVLTAKGRRKRLLVADMDSTLIRQECIDELAAHIGVGDRVAAITERAMRGEIEFEPALRQRVALLDGLPESVVAEVLATRIELMPGGRKVVATMRAHGAKTLLVSGGFTVFAGPIAEKLGFEKFQANTLLASAGRYTGAVAEPILGREAKVAALRDTCAAMGIGTEDAVAVGDGANDAAMIRAAGLGVAFQAKPVLRAAADAVIDHGDLTALLYLQGFSRAEFAAAG
jgi:phosphoserine phosphatase